MDGNGKRPYGHLQPLALWLGPHAATPPPLPGLGDRPHDSSRPAGRAGDSSRSPGAGRLRYVVLAMLFVVTTVNYADRSTLSIAGDSMQKDLHISSSELGLLFSAFSWSYLIAQTPGGWLLDRFGSKKVHGIALFLWSLFTMAQGGRRLLRRCRDRADVRPALRGRLRRGTLLPRQLPHRRGLVPTGERGFASALFNSAQYFATVAFAPLMGRLVTAMGWEHVFTVVAGVGVVLALICTNGIVTPCSSATSSTPRAPSTWPSASSARAPPWRSSATPSSSRTSSACTSARRTRRTRRTPSPPGPRPSDATTDRAGPPAARHTRRPAPSHRPGTHRRPMNPPAADEQSLRDLINSAPPQHLRTALPDVLAETTAARRRDHRPPPRQGCARAPSPTRSSTPAVGRRTTSAGPSGRPSVRTAVPEGEAGSAARPRGH